MVIKVSADLLNDHFPTAGRRPLALHMEEREKAKQIGALSPQSGNEAAEMDILNLFQTLALNHCFFYTVEKLTVITDILIGHLYGSKTLITEQLP